MNSKLTAPGRAKRGTVRRARVFAALALGVAALSVQASPYVLRLAATGIKPAPAADPTPAPQPFGTTTFAAANAFTLSSDKLTATQTSGSWSAILSSTSHTSGKYYWEITATSLPGCTGPGCDGLGITPTSSAFYPGSSGTGVIIERGNSSGIYAIKNGAVTVVNGVASYGAGNIIGVRLDLDNQIVEFVDVTGGCLSLGSYNFSTSIAKGTSVSAEVVALQSQTAYTANFYNRALTCPTPTGYTSGF